MNLSYLWLRVIFCLCLLPISFVGSFQFCFFNYGNQDLTFYISFSSAFIFAVAYLLNLYFVTILRKQYSEQLIQEFTSEAIRIDNNVISINDAFSKCDEFAHYIKYHEKCFNELFSGVIPYGECFLLLFTALFIVDYKILLFVIFAIFVAHTIVWFFYNVVSKNMVKSYAVFASKFCKSVLSAVRGIQFFGTEDALLKSVKNNIAKLDDDFKKDALKSLWSAFIVLCCVFVIVCIIYVVMDCFIEIIAIVTEYSLPTIFCILMYCVWIKSCFNFFAFRSKLIGRDALLDYTFTDEKDRSCGQINSKRDIFIAFHKVCFHDPALIFDKPIFNDLTFSVMPRESVAIIGERVDLAFYIFDLMFKFYKCQSGNIYIAGNNIQNVNTEKLREIFSVFKLDFGIIDATVIENIRLAHRNIDDKKILNIAEKVGLTEFLDKKVTEISQNTLIRLQMARILIRKSKIVVIDAQIDFDKKSSKELFMEFVNFISKKSTVFLVTTDTMMAVYCSKILYLGNNVTAFGTHAELSTNSFYRKFLT